MATKLVLDTLPSMNAANIKAAFKKARPGEPVPPMEASLARITIDPAHVAAYNRICGFPRLDRIPLTYPQILAGPVQAALLVQPEFPMKLVGMVHLGGRIEQNRPLVPGESLSVSVTTGDVRDHRLGREFDLVTTFTGNGVKWMSVTGVLVREKKPEENKKREKSAEPPGEPPGAIRSMIWKLPEDLGRRYAKISGDYNPIHQYAITAKAFGFPRAIIHGTWSISRAAAELDAETPDAAKMSFEFRKPVLLPGKVLFTAHRDDGALTFAVRNKDATSVHLTGRIQAA